MENKIGDFEIKNWLLLAFWAVLLLAFSVSQLKQPAIDPEKILGLKEASESGELTTTDSTLLETTASSAGLISETQPTPTPTASPSATLMPTLTSSPTILPPEGPTVSPEVKKLEKFKPVLNKKNFEINEGVAILLRDFAGENVKFKVFDKTGQEILAESYMCNDTLMVKVPTKFKPGKYKVVVSSQNETLLEQDFTWGVLAINTPKAIYLSGEKVNFALAVLDEAGAMVCDAELTLEIINPKGQKETLSTRDGTIWANPECKIHNYTVKPDYEAHYETQTVANYTLRLLAKTTNGEYEVTDSFEVRGAIRFDLLRDSATRIYPVKEYPVNFHLKANEDFEGTIEEIVPVDFDIRPGVNNLSYDNVSIQEVSLEAPQSPPVEIPEIRLPFKGSYPVNFEFGERSDLEEINQGMESYGIKGHDGIDYALPEGTEVLATDDGVVLKSEEEDYGNTIIIQHSWGESFYGHFSEFKVEKDQEVKKGEMIGLSGHTGFTTGPHLHFGIRPNYFDYDNGYFGKVDPGLYLAPVEESVSTQVLGLTDIKQTAKVITWKLSVKKGEEVSFGYRYKAPEISPQFYLLGPLQFKDKNGNSVFLENRQWQIASDEVAGANYPGTVVSTSGSWSNFTVAYLGSDDNKNRATTTSTSYATGTVRNFGFSIPTNTVIDGVMVEHDQNISNSSATSTMRVRISVDGGTNWSNYSSETTVTGTTSDVMKTAGGETDKWGLSLTPANINDNTNFQVQIDAKSSASNRSAGIDFLRVKVYYTPTINVTGTIYSDEGSSVFNCSQTNLTLGLAVDGVGVGTTTCNNANGTYSFTGVGAVSGKVVTLFLDGATQKATTITRSNNVGITVPLYQNRVLLSHEDTGPITNTDLGKYTQSNDASIPISISSLVFDNSISQSETSANTSMTIPFTVGNGNNRLLIVGITLGESSWQKLPSSVTYAGKGMTPLTSQEHSNGRIAMWYLVNPATGNNNVVASGFSSLQDNKIVGVVSFFGVDQTTPLGTYQTNSGTGNAISVSGITSASEEIVVDVLSTYIGSGLTPDGSQSPLWNKAESVRWGGGSWKNGATSTSMSWSGTSIANWAIIAVPVKPVSPTPDITIDTGNKLVVALGKTYTPGGNITTPSLGIGGTFNAGTYTHTLTGSGTSTTCTDASGTVMPLCVNGGTFNASTSTVNYYSTADSTVADLNYNNLGVGNSADAGVGANFTLGGNVNVGGILTIGNDSSTNTDTLNASNYTLTLSGSGTPLNITSKGTFNPGNSTVVYTGTSATTIAAASYNRLEIKPGVNSITHTLGAGAFSVGVGLTAGNGTNTTTIDASANNTVLDINGGFSISANTTFKAHSANSFTIAGSFINNGTFNANSGTVTFDDNTKTSSIYYGGIGSTQPFYNLSINTPGKQIKFDETEMTGVGGTFSAQGSDCDSGRVFLSSTTADNQWDIKVTGTTDIDYADIEDSNAILGITAENSTADNDDNSNWTIKGGVCGQANNPPSVDSVILNEGLNIELVENSGVGVSWTATVTDLDGVGEIESSPVIGKVYRSGVFGVETCTVNDNNCYSGSCNYSNCEGSACTVTCTVTIKFHADPTDSGSPYTTEYWRAWIQAEDIYGETSESFSAEGSPDVLSLLALDMDTSVSYGLVAAGEDSGSDNTETGVVNTGNFRIDMEMAGSDMCTDFPTCQAYTIAVTNQQYSLAPFTYGDENSITLTNFYQRVPIDLAKPATLPSDSYRNVYWGIRIPLNVKYGDYGGENEVYAVPAQK